MMTIKFKPGDLVRHKLGGPIMEVVRYDIDHEDHSIEVLNNEDVKCLWYDKGHRNTSIFNQRLLLKFQFFDVLESDSTE